MKEISRAYKIPPDNIDSIKEIYKQQKPPQKRKKNNSMPAKNLMLMKYK